MPRRRAPPRRPRRWTATSGSRSPSWAAASPACPPRSTWPRQGVDVAVLEAHEPGWGASGRNGGQVNPGLKYDPDTIEADFGPRSRRPHGGDVGRCAQCRVRPDPSHRITCEAPQSARCAPPSRAQRRCGARQRRPGRARGMPVTLLEPTQIAGGDRHAALICAMLDRRGGRVNPLGYARGLAQAAMGAGAAVHGAHRRSTRMQRNGGDWHLATPRGTVRADRWCWPPTATPTICGRACGAASCRCSAASSPPSRCRPITSPR